MTDKTVYEQIADLDRQIAEGLAEEEQLDKDIAALVAAQNKGVKRRFITTHDILTERLTVPWEDPNDLPKRPTTHDAITQSLTVPYVDPTPGKQKTTFDDVTDSLRREWTADGK